MSRTANALMLVVLGSVLLIGFLLMLLPSAGASGAGSVLSTNPDGRRALYLVLEELGYTPRSWTRSPGELPRAGHVLYLPDTPDSPPGYALGTEPAAGASRPSRRMRDPRHYLRFVEEGGTLITPVDGDAHLEFLADTLGLEPVRELALSWRSDDPELFEKRLEEERNRRAITTALLWTGEQLDLEWRPSATFEPLPISSPFQTLAVDQEGWGLAYALDAGRGVVVLLAPADDWLDNSKLELADNGLFFVRLIEEYARTKRVLFDEYALGGWVPDSPLALAFAPSAFGFSLHLLLWGLFALWMVVWARPFARDPEALGQVSALARAQGFAGMVAAAGRWNLLARMLRVGVMRRLAARVGRRPRLDTEREQVPLKLDEDEVKRVLELVLQGAKPEVVTRAHALLTTGQIGRAEELEALGERLAELERMVLVTEPEE